METSDFVIVGGIAAGPKTAATIVRRLPAAKVTLFQREDLLSYATCGLPFLASGELEGFRELTLTPYGVPRDADFFARSRGFQAVTGALVTDIDRERKVVRVRIEKAGRELEHGYGKLVLAMGAVPRKPDFPVETGERVRFFHAPDDAIAFRRCAERGEIEEVVIIGGGMIGCELAEACGSLWGIGVTLLERENQLLPWVLDPEMARMVERDLARRGVRIVAECNVVRVEAGGERICVVMHEESSLSADFAFLALGLAPHTELARKCGLALGQSGGIRVTRRMQTSDPHIYAAGDCVETLHRITERPFFLSMGSLANRHGRVVAENLAGNDAQFAGTHGTFFLKLYETNIAAVGLSQREAERADFRARAVWGTFPDKPDYRLDVKTFVLKMIYAADDMRLLGLQAFGEGDVYRPVDVFSSFLQRGALVHDLLDFEHGYHPAVSEPLDPLHHMAAMAIAQERGLSFLSPSFDPANQEPCDIVVLDVREREEAGKAPLPSRIIESGAKAVHLPLGELSLARHELDKEKMIVIMCKRGSRSYQAALSLMASGFPRVAVLAGGLEAYQ